jgi:hypothetical protein
VTETTQHDRRAPAITGPVREYLAAILDAVDLPAPARVLDAERRLLDERVGWVVASLRGLLADDSPDHGDVTFDLGYLRRKIEETPVTYELFRAPEAQEAGR